MAGLLARSRVTTVPMSSEKLAEEKTAPTWARPNLPASNDMAAAVSPLHTPLPTGAQRNDLSNSALVQRAFPRDGILYSYSYGLLPDVPPQEYEPVQSSKFQPNRVTLSDWIINVGWYICYPAATVMLGGKHNLGLTERTPQLDTRTSGGPGTPGMVSNRRPRYTKTQQVPRYPTNPLKYRTESANG